MLGYHVDSTQTALRSSLPQVNTFLNTRTCIYSRLWTLQRVLYWSHWPVTHGLEEFFSSPRSRWQKERELQRPDCTALFSFNTVSSNTLHRSWCLPTESLSGRLMNQGFNAVKCPNRIFWLVCFSSSCLRSWLEQDTSCPTCRTSLNINGDSGQARGQQQGGGLEDNIGPVGAPPDPRQHSNHTNHFFHFDGKSAALK